MKYNVTADDIKFGVRGDACGCPVWRAIYRQHKNLLRNQVIVASTRIEINGSRYYAPTEVREFINKFDGYQSVEPFFFELSH